MAGALFGVAVPLPYVAGAVLIVVSVLLVPATVSESFLTPVTKR